MSQLPGVTVGALLRSRTEAFGLIIELLAGGAGTDRLITSPHVQKTGLALAGFHEYLKPGRVLIFGESEIRYLESLEPAARSRALRLVASLDFPCILITGGHTPPAELLAEGEQARLPLLKTSLTTPTAIAKLSSILEDTLAERTVIHAVLMDVLGLGVLITGESGIGKSECALDLIVRGHRLVADDTVEVRRRAETILIGTCPELTRHHMELRGLGVINVKELFGIASIRSSKRVELVVQLERWDAGARVRAARPRRRVLRDSRTAGAAHPDAGRARAQHRHPGGSRGAQPAAARPRPPRGTAAGGSPRGVPPALGRIDRRRGRRGRPRAWRRRVRAGSTGRSTRRRSTGRRATLPRTDGEAARGRSPRATSGQPFIVLTGLSGSGKSQAIRALEDLGYFCVDNLPTTLIPTLARLSLRGDMEKVAIVVDVREGTFLSSFPAVFRRLRKMRGLNPVLIFLEASNAALVRRFSETRRPHPLAPGRSASEGIRDERARMTPIREMADEIVDTSDMTVHELRQFFMGLSQDRGKGQLVITVLSFGYKHGVPVDADLVFDVRCLPNPHFVPALRRRTGRDRRGGRVHGARCDRPASSSSASRTTCASSCRTTWRRERAI